MFSSISLLKQNYENNLTKLNGVVGGGFKLKAVFVVKLNRELSKTRAPGVVVAECKSRDDMAATIKVKRQLAESRNLKDIIITLDKPQEQRIAKSNRRATAEVLKDEVEFKGPNLVRKSGGGGGGGANTTRRQVTVAFWNVRRWNPNPQSDNYKLRNTCIQLYGCDIAGIAESHFMPNTHLDFAGYRWFGQNRKLLHPRARTGSIQPTPIIASQPRPACW